MSAGSVDLANVDDTLPQDHAHAQADEQPHPPTVAPSVLADETIRHDDESSVQQLEPKGEERPSGLASHTSVGSLSQDFRNIDEALKSIESNMEEMVCLEEEEEEVVVKEGGGGDEGTEDSESEGEDEEGEREHWGREGSTGDEREALGMRGKHWG